MKKHRAWLSQSDYLWDVAKEVYLKEEADAVIASQFETITASVEVCKDLHNEIAELKDSIFKHGHEITVLQARVDKRDEQIAELVELLEDIKRKLEDGQYWSPEMLKDELAEAINKHKGG